MKALINIDYTNDFVAENGALTAGKVAQDLEEYIVNITNEFYKNDDFVVFAIDNHFENDKFHPETKLFPPHNINGTDGQKLYGKLENLYQEIKDSDNVYYTFKTRYSAFHGTDIETKLRERNITEVHLVGVVTDICVLHTAMDAYNKGFDIFIHENGMQSFNADGHEWALQHFKNSLGAKII